MIARIALLAILLGLLMQALVIFARLLGGGSLPGIGALADLVQSVTWALFVCIGVSIGVAIGKARKALAGLMGLVFAPAGLAVAKAAQKSTLTLIDAMEQPVVAPLATVGLIRAVEYGLLAWTLTVLAEREVSRAPPYLLAGAITGIVFGGGLVALTGQTLRAADQVFALPQMVGMLVNEIGTPLGCALVIFIGQIVPQHFKTYAQRLPAGQRAPTNHHDRPSA